MRTSAATAVDLKAGLVIYLDTLEAAGRSPKTIRRYRGILEPFVQRLDGRYPTNLDVRDFLDICSSSNTRYLCLVTVRQWFAFLRKRGIYQDDPTSGIPLPKPRRRTYAPITREDFEQLRDRLPGEEMRVLATVLFFTGARIREAMAIRSEDVAFEGEYGTIEFRDRKGGQAGFAAFGPELAGILRPWCAQRPQGLFQTSYNQAHYSLATSGRLAGLPGRVTPHRLRHSFITWAVDNGWNQLALQQQLGHRNAASTAWYYRPTRAGLIGAYRRSSTPGVKSG